MYEYITGKLTELTPTYAVIETAGIGYMISISLQTYSSLENRQEAKLYLHHVQREDAQLLYGFGERIERELFRLLISVSGVGVGTARMILSTYSSDELRNIIASGNAALLKNVKGLGLKTAQKIIVDLSGKMVELKCNNAFDNAISKPVSNPAMDEALAALTMLGFQKAASEKTLKKIFSDDPAISVEAAIKNALKQL